MKIKLNNTKIQVTPTTQMGQNIINNNLGVIASTKLVADIQSNSPNHNHPIKLKIDSNASYEIRFEQNPTPPYEIHAIFTLPHNIMHLGQLLGFPGEVDIIGNIES